MATVKSSRPRRRVVVVSCRDVRPRNKSKKRPCRHLRLGGSCDRQIMCKRERSGWRRVMYKVMAAHDSDDWSWQERSCELSQIARRAGRKPEEM